MSKVQTISKEDKARLSEVLQQQGQLLLPILELVETSQVALDELIDVTGRAMLESLLLLSAQQLAGPKQRGKVGGDVGWHGSQGGVVGLSGRKVRVTKPRLRHKEDGEVAVPAYQAMQDSNVGERMLQILLRGVSTRNYEAVLPEMADTVGVKKSSVSREAIGASEATLKQFRERRWDDVELLAIYIDGVAVGDYHVIVALGIDSQGNKHVLGLREGATENAEVVKGLLVELVERGVKQDRKRLFIIDGSKALRAAINEVYGTHNPVQRCQEHKKRNVLGYLPKEQQEQTRFVYNAALKLDAEKGLAKLREHASDLEKKHPSAAASLREGMEELFTIHRLGLPARLRRCLRTTNIIENPNGGMRQRTRNVKRWRDGSMVLRWLAAAYIETEKHFRRIQGFKDLWMLDAALKQDDDDKQHDTCQHVA